VFVSIILAAQASPCKVATSGFIQKNPSGKFSNRAARKCLSGLGPRSRLNAQCLVAAIAVPTAAEYDREMAQDSAKDETQVWNLEKAYWEYVKANDLEKYRALWHDDFVGWPLFSSTPLRKDHVTDWITENMSKGIKLQSFSIEPLAVQVTCDVAIVHYRIKMVWAAPVSPNRTQNFSASPTPGFEQATPFKSSAAWLLR
jgi:Domain of unknown function (DUF4440)